ncbi:MAG: tRNA nucleotidyltransferase [Oscillospiraceae bacterium]|nr:tRNA nucleotidyltransferase [Oscillospiraceae bacterium]
MSFFEKDFRLAEKIARKANAAGGRAYFVGGYVRDKLSGKETKDIDIEVHGISPRKLCEILEGLGERISIGESFGIYALKGYSVDIAMPRREELRGVGHRDFDVVVDPFIGTESAARRRDFTVNAMLCDVLTGEIVDHFGGKDDLSAKVLRHVCEKSFPEDALRVLRAAQFAARFNFTVAEETVKLCSGMDLSNLPRERIEGELKKALLKAEKPSVFFEVLRKMNKLSEWFSELSDLIGIPQNRKYHAEGDVWVHTMMVLDAAAKYRDRAENPFGFMLAALVHDFGKAVCTECIDGTIHAYGHEEKGIPIARRFLERITGEKNLVDYALNISKDHMKPNVVAQAKASVKTTNRMFDTSPDPVALICLAVSDGEGKITDKKYVPETDFLYDRLEIYRERMRKPEVLGRDLIEAGLTPGEDFSEILKFSHKLHLAGIEKEEALKQALAFAKKLRKGT